MPSIKQFYLEVNEGDKMDVLARLIDVNDFKLSMVFCNTKRRVDELTHEMVARGYQAEGLHGDMKQSQRDRVMHAFKHGRAEILIATDVAARGLILKMWKRCLTTIFRRMLSITFTGSDGPEEQTGKAYLIPLWDGETCINSGKLWDTPKQRSNICPFRRALKSWMSGRNR